jgi:F0F1-type ATP synthase assembly protein I
VRGNVDSPDSVARFSESPVSEPDEDKKRGTNPWVKAGVFGALGMEFVATAIAGVVIGGWVDGRFDIEPLGTIACLFAALLGAGVHTFVITKRFVDDD